MRCRGLLQPPKPLNQGRLALDPSWRINLDRKNKRHPPVAGRYESLMASGPQKAEEQSPGESELSPWDFPGFPRMFCIRVGRFQRPGQKHTGCKIGCFLQATVGNCFLSALSNFRKRGSREIISLVRGLGPQRPQGFYSFLRTGDYRESNYSNFPWPRQSGLFDPGHDQCHQKRRKSDPAHAPALRRGGLFGGNRGTI